MVKVMIKAAFFLLSLSIVFIIIDRLGLTEVLANSFQKGLNDFTKIVSEYL